MTAQTIFDFNTKATITDWRVVDDVVMGGKSSGYFRVTEEGYGVFEGEVSLENNGGFSSVRYDFKTMETKPFTKIVLKVKGDGKTYQFRVKANAKDSYSYIAIFHTTGIWQEIVISLNEMYPAFRGRTLEQSNFHEGYIEQVAFLIGNKKAEGFQLLIDHITLQ